jgi:glucokinase
VKKTNIFIGVDLGGTNVRAGRVEQGEIVAIQKNPTLGHESREIVLEEVCRTIASVFRPEVAGIGVGVPSVVDAEKGIVYAVANIPSWQEVPLKQILEKRFGVPAFVNNDAKCFALGELHYGEGRGHRNLVGLIVGTGLGAGVVINGKLYSGSHGGAGEIGHSPYGQSEFEYYCSGRFFEREFGIDAFTAEQRADQGDPAALKMFEAFADHFADVIQAIVYTFDPEIIVLGGGVSKAFRHFEKPMWTNLKARFRFQHSLERLKIVVGKKPDIAVLAAAALCLDSQ